MAYTMAEDAFMQLSKEQVVAKIEQAEADMQACQRKLEYFRNLLEMISNPLFAEISSELAAKPSAVNLFPIEDGIPIPQPQYGLLKKRAYELLPESGSPITSQELAQKMQESGFQFRTKTPSISVNDTLRTLQSEGRARYVGKADNNAGLWLKAAAIFGVEGTEKEAPEGTS